MTDGRALVVRGPGELGIEAVSEALPLVHGEALIEVAFAGVCGSDRELVAGTRDPRFVRYPIVPGHEWSGTVVALGPGTDSQLLGRKVVGEGFRYCGACSACRSGATNLCHAGYDETGFTRPGACADLLRVPARLLHILSDDSDLRAAALLEPAACVAAAVLAVGVSPGERIAVVGGGTLGLLATQLLAAYSPAELIVIDPRPRRIAVESGASDQRTPEQASVLAAQFDLVVEAAGAHGSGRLALDLVRRGGRVALTGLHGGEDVTIAPAELVSSAVTIHTVFGAASNAWTYAVRALTTGALLPGLLIGDEYELDKAARVLTSDAPRPSGKVLFHP
ncbi:zinc-dependent alcohol dehydrogenase [Nocardia neocaledoniensis]|uniref:zinc-dependent alcohol dehydrogenase n=1 Tax=Nocardia neocaledoniensis TaxID=236511 RepID=UPI002454207F|nr:alcohol dehydrogenase catalytic domain-containing protein [Nocardia neocaledoniensis]